MTIYTGDILIQEQEDGSFDWTFTNGQPAMTNGLETVTLLYSFGEDWWGNGIVRKESEKMKSTFPDVIKRNVVTDQTKNDGTQALKRALKPMIDEKIAKSIDITGTIINAFSIGWEVTINSITDETIKFYINWQKGELTARFVSV